MAVIHSENLTNNDSRSTLAKYELPCGLRTAVHGERTMSALDKPAGLTVGWRAAGSPARLLVEPAQGGT